MSMCAKLRNGFLRTNPSMKGQIYIFTGTGKGKTSAALGMTLRAVSAGMTVAWVAWYKEASWNVSEYRMKEILPGVELYVLGKGFYFDSPTTEKAKVVSGIKVLPTHTGTVVDKHTKEEHKKAAGLALSKAREIILSQSVNVLVLDECCQAAAQGLISTRDVVAVLERRGPMHVVLTGRDCPQELIQAADTVTQMEKVKHAYDTGTVATKGLDF